MFDLKAFYCSVFFCLMFTVSVIDSIKYDRISSCDVNGQFWNGEAAADFYCGNDDNENHIFNEDPMYILNYLKIRIGLVRFKNCRIRELRRKFGVEFINLHTFNISDIELEVLQNNTMKGAKNLIKLLASNNRLREIPAHVFDDARKLTTIDFSNNAINKLNALSFKGAVSLITLNLSRNHFTSRDLTFPLMPALRILDLSMNPIGDLSATAFFKLSNLEHLILRDASITSIKAKTFLRQTKLISLDLSGNLLTKLNINIFHPNALSNLRSLSLNRNRLVELHCVQNTTLSDFVFLDLNNNNFNCSYLKQFMDFVHWERFHHQRNRTQSNRVNGNGNGGDGDVNGVTCKITSGNSSASKINPFQVEFCPAIDGSKIISKKLSLTEAIVVFVIVCICVSLTGGVHAYRRNGARFRLNDWNWTNSASTIQITIDNE